MKPDEKSPIVEAIARAEAAFKKGQLDKYVPLKSLNDGDKQSYHGWGPMMKT